MENHPNSHIVYIRRKSLFDTSERPELEEYFAGSSVSVVSYFAKGTARPASGLLIPEENLLLPHVLGIPAEDRDFRKEVNNYYSNINSKIPAMSIPARDEDGLPLEIGLYIDNKAPISRENLPLNVEQYLRYRQIIGHPQVGAGLEGETEDDAKGNQMRRFYVHDPAKAQTTTLSSNEMRDQALLKYVAVKTNPRTVRMYLTLLGVNVNSLRAGEELTRLRDIAEKNPADFLKISGDKNLEIKYMIEELVHYKILTRVGERVLNGNTEIGRSLLEAVLYLKDSHNTAVFASLKAALQNAWAKNSVSVELEEDLQMKDFHKESDDELEARLTRQQSKAAEAIDRTKGKRQPEPPDEPKATGLDIQVEPEPEYVAEAGTLGDLEAGTEGDDIILEDGEEAPVAINDGRAAEPTPDTIK